MADSKVNTGENITVFQVALMVLTILLLLVLLVDTLAPVDPEVSSVIQVFDSTVCLLYFVDFVLRFRRAQSKLEFMRLGWIDLIACIPNIEALRVARLVRVFRIIRVLRGLRVGHRVVSLLLRHKPKSVLISVTLSSLLLTTFSSIAILIAEQGPQANIKTAEDAMWWSVTTITTVGYGDKYPVTLEGRVIAMGLMICGVGVFGTLSGLVASYFLGPREEGGKAELAILLARLDQLEQRLAPNPPTTPIPEDGREAVFAKTNADSKI